MTLTAEDMTMHAVPECPTGRKEVVSAYSFITGQASEFIRFSKIIDMDGDSLLS
jgi:hypothetical protein